MDCVVIPDCDRNAMQSCIVECSPKSNNYPKHNFMKLIGAINNANHRCIVLCYDWYVWE